MGKSTDGTQPLLSDRKNSADPAVLLPNPLDRRADSSNESASYQPLVAETVVIPAAANGASGNAEDNQERLADGTPAVTVSAPRGSKIKMQARASQLGKSGASPLPAYGATTNDTADGAAENGTESQVVIAVAAEHKVPQITVPLQDTKTGKLNAVALTLEIPYTGFSEKDGLKGVQAFAKQVNSKSIGSSYFQAGNWSFTSIFNLFDFVRNILWVNLPEDTEQQLNAKSESGTKFSSLVQNVSRLTYIVGASADAIPIIALFIKSSLPPWAKWVLGVLTYIAVTPSGGAYYEMMNRNKINKNVKAFQEGFYSGLVNQVRTRPLTVLESGTLIVGNAAQRGASFAGIFLQTITDVFLRTPGLITKAVALAVFVATGGVTPFQRGGKTIEKYHNPKFKHLTPEALALAKTQGVGKWTIAWDVLMSFLRAGSATALFAILGTQTIGLKILISALIALPVFAHSYYVRRDFQFNQLALENMIKANKIPKTADEIEEENKKTQKQKLFDKYAERFDTKGLETFANVVNLGASAARFTLFMDLAALVLSTLVGDVSIYATMALAVLLAGPVLEADANFAKGDVKDNWKYLITKYHLEQEEPTRKGWTKLFWQTKNGYDQKYLERAAARTPITIAEVARQGHYLVPSA